MYTGRPSYGHGLCVWKLEAPIRPENVGFRSSDHQELVIRPRWSTESLHTFVSALECSIGSWHPLIQFPSEATALTFSRQLFSARNDLLRLPGTLLLCFFFFFLTAMARAHSARATDQCSDQGREVCFEGGFGNHGQMHRERGNQRKPFCSSTVWTRNLGYDLKEM